ncbi:MAG: autotransporter-associated beta strand repeat-containing protein, partial [Verrucomicrobium sp.]
RGQGQNTGSNFAAPITLTGTGSYRRLSVNEFTNHVLVEDHDFVINGTSGNKIAVGNDSTPTGDDIFEFNGDISLLSDLLIASEMQINPASSGLRTSYSRFNGAFSGSRNLSTSVAIGTAADQRRGVFEFNGVNTGWTGSLTVGNAGNDVNKLHVVRIGNAQGIGAANNVILRHNSTFQVGGLGVKVGNLSTTGAAGATSTEVIENASHVAGTLTVTQTVDASWDAYFRDGTPVGTLYETEDADPAASLSIVKAGAATATLTLDNAYTGSTTVQSGTLQVGSGGSKTARAVGDTGTGSTTTVLSVNSGATVAGTGTIVGIRDTVTPANTTTHVLQGTLRPGDVQGSAVTPGDFTNLGTLAVKGNLDARGGTFAFQMGGASMRVDTAFAALEVGSSTYNSYLTTNVGTWDESATAANRFDHDFLDIDGQLLLNGESSFVATFTTGYNPVAGTIIDLMDWAGVLGGTGFDVGQNFRSGGAGGGDLYLPTLANPTLYYDVSQFATNGIILVVTPEPGRTLLLLIGMFGVVWTRRRRN